MEPDDVLGLTHETFGRLRLAQFLPTEMIEETSGWEYLDRLWVGEVSDLNEWLRLLSEPEVLRSIAFSLQDLPESTLAAILDELRLPLRPGMSADHLIDVLGPITNTTRFVADRVTLDFEVGASDRYEVGCTVHESRGLTYLTVHTIPLPH